MLANRGSFETKKREGEVGDHMNPAFLLEAESPKKCTAS